MRLRRMSCPYEADHTAVLHYPGYHALWDTSIEGCVPCQTVPADRAHHANRRPHCMLEWGMDTSIEGSEEVKGGIAKNS
jgi:hypothetical protein